MITGGVFKKSHSHSIKVILHFSLDLVILVSLVTTTYSRSCYYLTHHCVRDIQDEQHRQHIPSSPIQPIFLGQFSRLAETKNCFLLRQTSRIWRMDRSRRARVKKGGIFIVDVSPEVHVRSLMAKIDS